MIASRASAVARHSALAHVGRARAPRHWPPRRTCAPRDARTAAALRARATGASRRRVAAAVVASTEMVSDHQLAASASGRSSAGGTPPSKASPRGRSGSVPKATSRARYRCCVLQVVQAARCTRIWPAGTCWQRSSPSACAASSSRLRRPARPSVRGHHLLDGALARCRSGRAILAVEAADSARRPAGARTPLRMPSASATRQACCPPAPPNTVRA